eukprot:CAMPEP_0185908604 /NCGR_PEP_ID=MMETSP0196C-20130402/9271_1 /TAXON_ID=2932 /ORGANISM="Alexandrium fundyense, Strain CCMP1719" /LENGTH=39 /DNA_ID= /DNA_START= /DNA_END= /DNA_ORIENTATION=
MSSSACSRARLSATRPFLTAATSSSTKVWNLSSPFSLDR